MSLQAAPPVVDAPQFLALEPRTLLSATWWVSPTGSDANAGGSAAPFATIAHAVTTAAPGDTVRLTAGHFVLPTTVNLNKAGLSIIGNGRSGADRTTIAGAWNTTDAYIQTNFVGPALFDITANNVTFSDAQLTGDSTATTAVRDVSTAFKATNVTGFSVSDCDLLNFKSDTLKLVDVAQSSFHDLSFAECAYEWYNWSSGTIALRNVTDTTFDTITITSTLAGTGYGVKASGSPYHLTRVDFSNLHIDLKRTQAWQNKNAPNFAFELINIKLADVTIRDSFFRNVLSLPGIDRHTSATAPYALRIHHNEFYLKPWAYWIELAGSSIEVDHNFVRHEYAVDGHAYLTDFHSTGSPLANRANLSIHHNTVQDMVRFIRLKNNVSNVKVYNNTTYVAPVANNTTSTVAFILRQGTGGMTNWEVRNNIFVNQAVNPAEFFSVDAGVPAPSGLTVTHNRIHNATLGDLTPADATLDANTFGDPGLRLAGDRPTPFYLPASTASPVVDAGVNLGDFFRRGGTDIGAHEFADYAVDLANAGFEQPGVSTKDKGFDGSPDVPAWQSAGGSGSATGVDNAVAAASGSFYGQAWHQSSGFFQTSSRVLSGQDQVSLFFAGQEFSRTAAQLRAELYYLDGGTRTTFATADFNTAALNTWQPFTLSATAPAAAAGKPLGVLFRNSVGAGGIRVDNADLAVISPVIPLVNAGFEQPGVSTNNQGFDGATDVPGWQSAGGSGSATGVNNAVAAASGSFYAQAWHQSAGFFQTTSHALAAGQTINLAFAGQEFSTSAAQLRAELYYLDGTTRVTFATTDFNTATLNTWQNFTLSGIAPLAAAGKPLGVFFRNSVGAGGIRVDDVALTYSA